jgi:hypothetical protein
MLSTSDWLTGPIALAMGRSRMRHSASSRKLNSGTCSSGQ